MEYPFLLRKNEPLKTQLECSVSVPLEDLVGLFTVCWAYVPGAVIVPLSVLDKEVETHPEGRKDIVLTTLPGWHIEFCVPKVWILLLGRVDGSLFVLKMQAFPHGAQTLEAEEVRMGFWASGS